MAWTVRTALVEMAEASLAEASLEEVKAGDPDRNKRVARAVKNIIRAYVTETALLKGFADDFTNPGTQLQFNQTLKKELSKLDKTNHRVF